MPNYDPFWYGAQQGGNLARSVMQPITATLLQAREIKRQHDIDEENMRRQRMAEALHAEEVGRAEEMEKYRRGVRTEDISRGEARADLAGRVSRVGTIQKAYADLRRSVQSINSATGAIEMIPGMGESDANEVMTSMFGPYWKEELATAPRFGYEPPPIQEPTLHNYLLEHSPEYAKDPELYLQRVEEGKDLGDVPGEPMPAEMAIPLQMRTEDVVTPIPNPAMLPTTFVYPGETELAQPASQWLYRQGLQEDVPIPEARPTRYEIQAARARGGVPVPYAGREEPVIRNWERKRRAGLSVPYPYQRIKKERVQ